MPLDHSRANVTISLAGLALSCINQDMRNRCEVGIIRCDRHRPLLDIQRIEMEPGTRVPLRSCLIPHALNLDEDILIRVVYPNAEATANSKRGVSTYTRREFDRKSDTGDPDDFRWVPDLEGPEFHNVKLSIADRSKLQPTIFLSDGVLYNRQKTEEVFVRTSTREKQTPRLGKLGHGMGADITCGAGGVVVLSNCSPDGSLEPGYSLQLPQSDHVKYLITIENLCQAPFESDDGSAIESQGTDFRLFYQVLKDPKGRQFDLRRTVETGCSKSPTEALRELEDFVLDGYPECCLVAFLSRTQTTTSGD